jgi:hypothetical protein
VQAPAGEIAAARRRGVSKNIDSERRGLVPDAGVTEPRVDAKSKIKTWKTAAG